MEKKYLSLLITGMMVSGPAFAAEKAKDSSEVQKTQEQKKDAEKKMLIEQHIEQDPELSKASTSDEDRLINDFKKQIQFNKAVDKLRLRLADSAQQGKPDFKLAAALAKCDEAFYGTMALGLEYQSYKKG